MRWVFGGLMVMVLGCASVRVTRTALASPVSLSAIAVYPVRVLGDNVPPWRIFELGERVVNTALETSGQNLAFFGPSEFQVMRWDEDSAWVASTALPQIVKFGVPPDKAGVLRISAEKRVGSQVQERQDATGRAKGGVANEETTWVCRVELLHPSTQQLLVEVATDVTVDPFAKPSAEDEFDPAPALTQALTVLVRKALETIEANVTPVGTAPQSKVVFAETPAQTAAFPDPEIARLDSVSAELWMQNRAKFLSPELDDALTPKVAAAGRGLWVIKAPASAGVQPGDLVIEIEGSMPQRQVLARKRLTITPTQVKVRRGAAEFETTIP